MPLPHISASLPSALSTRMRASAGLAGQDRQHAVAADAEAAIAERPHDRRILRATGRRRRRRTTRAQVDDEEVVAQPLDLRER